MIKIITAIGSPNLNNELKKYSEFCVIGNDILYFDGIMELINTNSDINYLILGDFFEESNIDKLINETINKNNKINIIAIINKKNKNLKNLLQQKGIIDIFYDDSDLYEIINLLKTKNIEYLNIELREEINKLKKLIEEKNNKKFCNNKNNLLENSKKIIGITGARGIGKTSFCIMFANAIKQNKKILIIDFDLINSEIGDFYNKKIEYSKIDELNLNNYIFNIDENIDIITGLNFLYYYNKINFEKIKNQIIKLKEKYDYIIVDTYSEITFEINKYIFDIFESIIVLSGNNKIEKNKTKKLLNTLTKKWNVNNKKIKLVFYNCSFLEIFKLIRIYKRKIYQKINIIRNNKER